jgi:hypothetical protein
MGTSDGQTMIAIEIIILGVQDSDQKKNTHAERDMTLLLGRQ